jgi:hypothetical protein
MKQLILLYDIQYISNEDKSAHHNQKIFSLIQSIFNQIEIKKLQHIFKNQEKNILDICKKK